MSERGSPHIERLPPVHGPGQVCGVPRHRASKRTALLSVSSISPHNFLHKEAREPQRVQLAEVKGALLSAAKHEANQQRCDDAPLPSGVVSRPLRRNRRAAVNRKAAATRTRGRRRGRTAVERTIACERCLPFSRQCRHIPERSTLDQSGRHELNVKHLHFQQKISVDGLGNKDDSSDGAAHQLATLGSYKRQTREMMIIEDKLARTWWRHP